MTLDNNSYHNMQFIFDDVSLAGNPTVVKNSVISADGTQAYHTHGGIFEDCTFKDINSMILQGANFYGCTFTNATCASTKHSLYDGCTMTNTKLYSHATTEIIEIKNCTLTDVNIQLTSWGASDVTLDIQNNSITQNTMVVSGKTLFTLSAGKLKELIFLNNDVTNNTSYPLGLPE